MGIELELENEVQVYIDNPEQLKQLVNKLEYLEFENKALKKQVNRLKSELGEYHGDKKSSDRDS